MPVRTLLLDTCALLDLLVSPQNLAPDAQAVILDPGSTLIVSAASAWEIAIKARHGRLDGAEHLLAAWDQALLDLQAKPLAIDHADAIRAGSLAWTHRDPFDRMIVAQAQRRNVAVATSDQVVLDAGVVPTFATRR